MRVAPHPSQFGKNYRNGSSRAEQWSAIQDHLKQSSKTEQKGKKNALQTGKWNEYISDSYIGLLAHNKNHIRYTAMLLYVIQKKL